MVSGINCRLIIGLVLTGLLTSLPTHTVHAETWTLQASIKRALEISPEMKAVDAELAAQEAGYREAGAWPNPTIEVRADDSLGLDDGTGGTDVTEFTFSQPLPLRRLNRQRDVASALIDTARENHRYQALLVEQETARAYHTLQLAAAKRDLAKRLVSYAREYTQTRRDPLVRYLAPVERQRLAIVQEEAEQAAITAETEYRNAYIEFQSLLELNQPSLEVAMPVLPGTPLPLATLERQLEAHPALVAAQHEVQAARGGVAVAESQRFTDPELNLFNERDVFNAQRENVKGIGLSMQIPLWNTNRGPVDRARANARRAETEWMVQQRDALVQLRQRHADLSTLLTQAERSRERLSKPAEEVLTLTRRGFASGELDVLSLVDAINTYFEVQTHYSDLMYRAQLAAAELRLAAGQSVLEEKQP